MGEVECKLGNSRKKENMRKIIKGLIDFKRITLDRALLVSYKKINSVPDIKAGYVDLKTVAKRYATSSEAMDTEKLLRQPPIRDSFYFLETDSEQHLKDSINNDQYKLLDVGCGSGIYSKVFKREDSIFKNIEYNGCDIDKEIIEVCKKINPEGNFFVSYADNISVDDNTYDIVFCSGTLHYTRLNWKKSVKEMTRVSKKDVALVRFPVTKYSETFFVHQSVKGINGGENHYFIVINRRELENYFAEIGLKIINRDYSLEEYNVEGVEEKIILVQYLLEKNRS